MMVVREGLALSSVGMVIGLLLAVIFTRLAAAVLYGVSPLDPMSLGGGMFLLLLASVGATLPAALRAARVDPVQSLRTE
jgi:ABC-type antimicrobial peptide transport system permease subunit